jgi:hypothetical protein
MRQRPVVGVTGKVSLIKANKRLSRRRSGASGTSRRRRRVRGAAHVEFFVDGDWQLNDAGTQRSLGGLAVDVRQAGSDGSKGRCSVVGEVGVMRFDK